MLVTMNNIERLFFILSSPCKKSISYEIAPETAPVQIMSELSVGPPNIADLVISKSI